MKKIMMLLILLVAIFTPAIVIMGCDDKVEVHQERTLAPRTVEQHEVVTP